jgi:hypothetical protein
MTTTQANAINQLQVNSFELIEPEPIEPGASSFADSTRQAVDDVIEKVCTEFGREVATLRDQLDQFERMLVQRAARTKGDMLGFVDLVKAGHELTTQITTRLDRMRTELNGILGHDRI